MKMIFLSILLIQLYISNSDKVDLSTYYITFMKDNGFNLELHDVVTDDGYILSLWHLMPKSTVEKVAYFQHGLSDTAWCFFQLGSKSLPFLLAKNGFDVWLGNGRGNVFSLKHKTKDPADKKSGFFDYTMDDNVQYDLPATIKYIKLRTGGKKMSYIAHSQGSTIFFMLYMQNPSLIESSFDHFTSIGTVPNIAHAAFSPIKFLDVIYGLFDIFSFGKGVLTLTHEQRLKTANFCKTLPFSCETFFENGANIKYTHKTDYKKVYNYLYYYPGGTSKLNLLQWSQIHTQKKLVYYNPNYEKEKTAKAYKIKNVKKWKIKALVARTDMDTLSSYEDVTEFYNNIEDKSYIKLLDLTQYGHLDVLAADSAYNDIVLPMFNFLKN